jgi:phosphatidylinositol dimannoside acyltransferase
MTYLGYRTGSAIANSLPEALARPAATAAGRLLGMGMRGRRQMLGRHLRRAHGGELTGRELDRAVDRAFRSYARYWLEAFRLAKETPEGLRQRLDVQGLEHVDAAMAGGRGVIIAAPHLGNWDLGGAWFAAQGYRPATVMEPIEPPALFEWFMSFRNALGMETVALGPSAGTAMLRVLREGRMVGLICDRDLGGRGIEVEFFGERTTLPSGPATLALRSGAPILAAATYFGTGRRHVCIVRPPVSAERRGSVREDSMRITQAVATELEELIRRAPDQWHLLQPNWPSDFEVTRVHRRPMPPSTNGSGPGGPQGGGRP